MDGEELRTRYCQFMSEIKTRLQAIYDLMDLNGGSIPGVILLEACYLQLRMIAELIAISSLSAHGELVDGLTSKLRKEYSADRIIEAAELLHPDFYPQPGNQILGQDGSVDEVEKVEHGYLTKPELKTMYYESSNYLHRGRVGNVLDAKSRVLDHERVMHWCNLIVRLLDHHQIQTVEEGRMFFVVMHVKETGAVQLAVMQKLPRDGSPEPGDGTAV